MKKSPRILIVSSDEDRRDFLSAAVGRNGFDEETKRDCESAYNELLGAAFDLIILDLVSDAGVTEFIRRVHNTPQFNRIQILVTGAWGSGQPTLALSQGVDGFEPDPLDERRLLDSIERLMQPHVAVVE
jgi:DNA-binding response OmpR family regulator